MKNPLITIITPSYNQAQFVEETVQSVLNQTYKNIEYIVVDGASNDGSIEILEKFRDKIDTLIIEKDNGQSDAINKGFKLAKGELICWINSDDTLEPTCVEQIAALYQMFPMGAIFYSSTISIINEKSEIVGAIQHNIDSKLELLRRNYDVIQPGSFYNRKAVEAVGFIDQNLHYCMDLDLWLRLLNYGSIHSINDVPLAQFRIWGETKTSLGGIKFLNEIRTTLIKHGARFWYKSVLKTYWQALKIKIRSQIRL